jgi:beta-phosphoglucomutase-like phosphatase (HAD superfamily)
VSAGPAALGLDAVLFDLDGVVTHTARLHAGVELLKLIEARPASLLVVGWHGRFRAGHARVVKNT